MDEGSLLVFILYVQLLERGKNENWGVEFVWVTPGASFLPPLLPFSPLFHFPPFPQTCKLSIAIYQSNILSGPIAGSSVERPFQPLGVWNSIPMFITICVSKRHKFIKHQMLSCLSAMHIPWNIWGILKGELVLHVGALKRPNGFPLRLKWAGKALNGYKLQALVFELFHEMDLWDGKLFLVLQDSDKPMCICSSAFNTWIYR